MIWPRIHEWARLKPAKSAIVYNGEPIDYASFARAIAATHRYLQSLALPPGRTAIVLDSNPVDAWVLVDGYENVVCLFKGINYLLFCCCVYRRLILIHFFYF